MGSVQTGRERYQNRHPSNSNGTPAPRPVVRRRRQEPPTLEEMKAAAAKFMEQLDERKRLESGEQL
jgi:hypothetical protein